MPYTPYRIRKRWPRLEAGFLFGIGCVVATISFCNLHRSYYQENSLMLHTLLEQSRSTIIKGKDDDSRFLEENYRDCLQTTADADEKRKLEDKHGSTSNEPDQYHHSAVPVAKEATKDDAPPNPAIESSITPPQTAHVQPMDRSILVNNVTTLNKEDISVQAHPADVSNHGKNSESNRDALQSETKKSNSTDMQKGVMNTAEETTQTNRDAESPLNGPKDRPMSEPVSGKFTTNLRGGNSHSNLQLAIGSNTTEKIGSHHPDYFTYQVPLEKLLERKSLLRVYSGCSIAAWSYSGFTDEDNPKLNDCYLDKGRDALNAHQVLLETAAHIQAYDSIYVPIVSLERFAERVLPHIRKPFILMTGQRSKVDPFSKELHDMILSHPLVIHWFLQNLSLYSYNPYHAKLSPWPYGVFPLGEAAYLEEMKKNVTRDRFIYVGYLRKETNKQARTGIPRQFHRDTPQVYYDGMHHGTYVLSPDGDRPECHRHYEAIGLGTLPLTQLDPYLHRHLVGNIIFENTEWNLDKLEKKLPRNPHVNRRMVFEEYWMEYVEREVLHPVRWWDPSRNKRSSLAEITDTVKNSATGEKVVLISTKEVR